MENKNEAVIANYIEKMMGERRQKIFESDEYIQQDNGDLDYLEERYSSLKIPYVIRRVVDDYIACLESRDERYADMSYVAGMGDAISLLIKMAVNGYDFFQSSNAGCRKWLRFSTWTAYKVSRYA